MTSIGASRMFRAAVMSAIDTMAEDPRTMAAVDALAEGFQHGIQGMLDYLWKYPEGVQWGSLLGLEYSSRKQQAVHTVTGQSWQWWLDLVRT